MERGGCARAEPSSLCEFEATAVKENAVLVCCAIGRSVWNCVASRGEVDGSVALQVLDAGRVIDTSSQDVLIVSLGTRYIRIGVEMKYSVDCGHTCVCGFHRRSPVDGNMDCDADS